MFVGVFKLIVDNETALLRVDLLENGATGSYSLTDSSGDVTTWTWDLTSDTNSHTFADRGAYGLVVYLIDCASKGFRGSVEPVQLSFGLDLADWQLICQSWNLDRSCIKPDHMSLQ